ncbi:MAG: bifunctional DNA primase/polymerase [Gammaproteobacteria bacterium]|nr:bifunctional DNA primase/polymerase [Gammaproteobacteria bacterium]
MTNLEIALTYLSYHWSVIPIRSKEKIPLISWLEYQRRLPSEEEIRMWFAQWPDANIGIVTGVISGLVVLDVDPKHGGDESLMKLVAEQKSLPDSVKVATGGGGMHVYFSHPGGVVHNKVDLMPGIDLRGDGGCIVAPPSLHKSGKLYQWQTDHAPDQIAIAAMPTWLQNLLKQNKTGEAGHSLKHWRELLKATISEGKRNNTIASISGHLLWHEVDLEVVIELMLCWNRERCKPPLSDEEVVHLVESINRTHEKRAK